MKALNLKKYLFSFTFLAFGMIALSANAQYPNKSVKMIVPFPAGQATDIFARVVAEELTQMWGQAVIIDNKGGGNSIPGTVLAKDAPPDGYTLMMASSSILTANPALYSNLPYEPKDFVMINGVFIVPLLLVQNQSGVFKSLAQMVDFAKKNPGKLEWSYAATNQQLAEELFKYRANVDILSVPYRGSSQSVTDLIGGQISLSVETLPAVLPHIKSGKVIPLASMTANRIPQLPDLPTVSESGYPGFEGPGWGGVVAPKGTPKAIVDKISADIRKVLAKPEVAQKIIDRGAIVDNRDSTQWSEFVTKEIAKWAEIVSIAKIKGQ